jgi:hypothetical protein
MDDETLVKLHIPLAGAASLPVGSIRCDFRERSFDLRVRGGRALVLRGCAFHCAVSAWQPLRTLGIHSGNGAAHPVQLILCMHAASRACSPRRVKSCSRVCVCRRPPPALPHRVSSRPRDCTARHGPRKSNSASCRNTLASCDADLHAADLSSASCCSPRLGSPCNLAPTVADGLAAIEL